MAVDVTLTTTRIFDPVSGTFCTPKFVFKNVSASATDSSIVAAVTGKKIRVLAYIAGATGTATTYVFNSKPSGAGAAITGTRTTPAQDAHSYGFSPVGLFETVAGEGLTMSTGAGSTIGLDVVYIEVS